MNSKTSRIGIDLSPLYDGNAIRGVGYYTQQLTEAITRVSPQFPHLQVEFITRQLPDQQFDLLHFPSFDPFHVTLPFRPPTPYLITIHDLIPITYSSHFPVGIKGNLSWLIQKHLLQKSAGIITVSQASKSVITQLTTLPASHVTVTPGAADNSFQRRTPTPQLISNLTKKYRLPPRFILYSGDINWNKNVPNLVRACLSLDLPLVIVGSSATKSAPRHPWTQDIHWLQQIASEPANHPKIILTGFVPDSEFPYFFNLATFYCQPSYAEGFGLPLLQAMQSGCPICCSNTDAISEIVTSHGLKFDPFSLESIQLSLSQMWTSDSLRQKYIQLGLRRAQDFSWEKTAVKTLHTYQTTLRHEE